MRRRLAAISVAAGLLAACGGDDGPGTVSLYDRAPVPAVPDRTSPVVDPPTDGVYWADLVDASADDLSFLLTQALFAQACVDALSADACDGDFAVIAEPSLLLITPTAALTSASVAALNRQNFAVDAAELVALAGGGSPNSAAPANYAFVAFPFLVTVRDSTVVEARQIWMP